MKLLTTHEDYLKAMLILENEKGHVRNADLVNYFGYTFPSITRAIYVLGQGGYLYKDGNRDIILTEKGRAVSKALLEKHLFFMELFVSIGVEKDIALKDACKIEHAISEETFEKLKIYHSL